MVNTPASWAIVMHKRSLLLNKIVSLRSRFSVNKIVVFDSGYIGEIKVISQFTIFSRTTYTQSRKHFNLDVPRAV